MVKYHLLSFAYYFMTIYQFRDLFGSNKRERKNEVHQGHAREKGTDLDSEQTTTECPQHLTRRFGSCLYTRFLVQLSLF